MAGWDDQNKYWGDVTNHIDTNMARVDSMGSKYDQALVNIVNALSNIWLPAIPDPKLPEAPDIDSSWLPKPDTVPSYQEGSIVFPAEPGDIGEPDDKWLDFGNDDPFAGLTAPVAPILTIPSTPTMGQVTKPQKPVLDTSVSFPTPPSTALPVLDALHEIKIPSFTFPDIPDFNGNPPDPSDISVPSVFIQWQEPEYEPLLLDELVAKVNEWLKGGTGIPPAVEQALFERARERETSAGRKAVEQAANEWASRGFTLPQGPLQAQIDSAREQERMNVAALNRDVWIEASKWEIENIRFAVQQGIALESMWINKFLEAARRSYEIARFQVEAQISLFNAQIGLFNAKAQAFQILADVWKTKIDAALAKLQAWKTAIEGQALIAQINQQLVDVYRARLDAVKTAVAIYSEEMKAASIKLDAVRIQADLFRTEVQAYAEELNAEKVKFDVYESQIRGETAKAGMFEAESRSFAALVSAIGSQQDVYVKKAQAYIDFYRAKAQAFTTRWQAYSQQITALVEKERIRMDAYRAQLSGWSAKWQADMTGYEAQTRYADLKTRTNIAFAEAQISRYNAIVNENMQRTSLNEEGLKAAGQFSAQMAAGALSAMNMSAQISANYGLGYHWNVSQEAD